MDSCNIIYYVAIYMAMAEAIKEVLRLKGLFDELSPRRV